MATWEKGDVELKDGTKVAAQMPVIVSASRSTDVPAFYADTNNAMAMENWKRHCECPHAETITGESVARKGCGFGIICGKRDTNDKAHFYKQCTA